MPRSTLASRCRKSFRTAACHVRVSASRCCWRSVTLLLYLPVRHADFLVFDDNEYVTENHVVQQGLTGAVFTGFSVFYASNWHPVTWLSVWLDCQLFGL